MKVQRTKDHIHVALEGSIGESTPLFIYPVLDATEMVIDMTQVSYINSIGSKHWTFWVMKLPKTLTVKILNCPFVIVSQANLVVGFVNSNMTIESFRMPYVCEACGYEEARQALRGREYDYSGPNKNRFVKVESDLPCPKCKELKFTPDFFIEKTFKFLT